MDKYIYIYIYIYIFLIIFSYYLRIFLIYIYYLLIFRFFFHFLIYIYYFPIYTYYPHNFISSLSLSPPLSFYLSLSLPLLFSVSFLLFFLSWGRVCIYERLYKRYKYLYTKIYLLKKKYKRYLKQRYPSICIVLFYNFI